MHTMLKFNQIILFGAGAVIGAALAVYGTAQTPAPALGILMGTTIIFTAIGAGLLAWLVRSLILRQPSPTARHR